jgi:hypothetical protein
MPSGTKGNRDQDVFTCFAVFLILVFAAGLLTGKSCSARANSSVLYAETAPPPILLPPTEPTISTSETENGGRAVFSGESLYTVSTVEQVVFDKAKDIISREEAWEIANEIVYQMSVYGMYTAEDMPYVLALFYQESRFNPRVANSSSSARGIGQIMMSLHHRKFDRYEDWSNISDNIAVAFQLINGGYNGNLPPELRWWQVLRRYCGNESNARNALRHVRMFKELLKSST